jgi:hypothetical protein
MEVDRKPPPLTRIGLSERLVHQNGRVQIE